MGPFSDEVKQFRPYHFSKIYHSRVGDLRNGETPRASDGKRKPVCMIDLCGAHVRLRPVPRFESYRAESFKGLPA